MRYPIEAFWSGRRFVVLSGFLRQVIDGTAIKMCCDQTGAVNRQQYALAWWVLLFITGLPVFCVASDEPVVIDLAATDVDTRALLESMLESARENPGSAEARGHLGLSLIHI